MSLTYTRHINSGAELEELFQNHNRAGQFTHSGFDMVYDDLVSMDYGEVDVIEICGMYSEYTFGDYLDSYCDEDDMDEWIEENEIEGVDASSDFSAKVAAIEANGVLEEFVEHISQWSRERIVGITDDETIIVFE